MWFKVFYRKSSLVQVVINEEELWKSAKPLENDKISFDVKNRATFNDIRVNISTRMTPIQLKFQCHVKEKGREQITLISSPLTNPIIVITNESQWGEAAGKLFSIDLFVNNSQNVETTWQAFANELQRYTFAATQQNSSAPHRPLCEWELNFIHQKFFLDQIKVTRKQVEDFWGWFGQVMITVRFKRNVKPLWFNGVIYGFISKGECRNLLISEEPGTFIIRFSDSVAGSFAIAYSTDDPQDRVKHYLIKPEDIGSNKTLPDFLRERNQFKCLIKIDPINGSLNKKTKDEALSSLYTKRPESRVDKLGYVQTVT